MPITFSNIGMEEPSTITHRAAAVTIARGSTNEQQEILCIGDGQSSLGIAVVTDSAPASTAFSLAVRQVGYVAPSTDVSVSTGSVRVHQSSAADLNVTVAGYVAPSTTVAVSTGSLRVHQSSAADLNVTVAGYSTTVNVSSISGVVATAEVLPASTFASGSKGTSGDTEIVSSAATRIHVYGYHLSIDSTTPTIVRLLSGSTTEMARWVFRAPSSISIGANLAITPPGYLYRTGASVNLTLNTDSTATVHYSVQVYRA